MIENKWGIDAMTLRSDYPVEPVSSLCLLLPYTIIVLRRILRYVLSLSPRASSSQYHHTC